MSEIKYPKLTIEFSKSNNAELVALDAEIRECEAIRNQLVSEMAEIDKSIRKYKESLYKTSEDFFHFSDKAFSNVSERHVKSGKLNKWDKANLLAGAVSAGGAALTGTFGFITGKVKEYEAKKEFNKKMDALMQKKMNLAETKLPYVADIYDKMASGPFARMEKLYSSLFQTKASGEYEMISKQLAMFKCSFGMALKARYLEDSLAYIIAEMQAWLQGNHDSDYQQKSYSDLFYEEVVSWPRKFEFTSWRKLLKTAYESDDSSIRLPIAFVFSDPVMLNLFAGISLPKENELMGNDEVSRLHENNEESGSGSLIKGKVIQEIDEGDNIRYLSEFKLKNTIAGSLIEKNEYYRKYVDIVRNSYVFPKKPKGFGIADLIVLLLGIGAPVWYVFYILNACNHLFFKILFLGIPALLIVYYLGFLLTILPCYRRENRYNDKTEKTRSNISSQIYDIQKFKIKL